jgi:hypothetical protein
MRTVRAKTLWRKDPVAVIGPAKWWQGLLSDLFFITHHAHYRSVHGVGENPSDLRDEIALRKDAEEWAVGVDPLMQAAQVDVEWLVQDYFRRM